MSHADVDLKAPPRRRFGAVTLVRDPDGRVLLVKPTYEGKRWILPGGGAHQDETLTTAAQRELREETGLIRQLTHLIALDYVPFNPENGVSEGINVVFDGGTLTTDDAHTVTIPDTARHELAGCAWVHAHQLDEFCAPYQTRRIRQALNAIDRGASLPLLELGHTST
ncbi:NUDIX hydrolase [Streptomyces sp. AJS327]|uniref:NUDIX domain-containing protein n=1 Tax=Streptomyces sp. AJS327 TaxID=2545265 RepID=UPI0015DD6CF9|nr:NUDIX hydrolase [Streptomyces sp. AJS327]MBA0053645.1 NUDIX hydrolase [Streptomyces sp. AJS327]